MIPNVTIKRHDAGKIISGQFKDANGVAIDCTGFTSAKIFMTNVLDGTVKINGSAFTFVTVNTGSWKYIMSNGDVDTSGLYKLELELVLPGPQTITFPTDPDDPYLIVRVQDDLG